MLDVAGFTPDRVCILALTQIDIELLEPALDVSEAYLAGQVTAEARTQVFQRGAHLRRRQQGRAIGVGNRQLVDRLPDAKGFEYFQPGRGVDPMTEVPPLWPAFTGRRRGGWTFRNPLSTARDRY
jgi:hypothetical protein